MARPSPAGFRRPLAFLALSALTSSAFASVTLSSFPPNPSVLPGGGWQFTSGTTFADPPPPRAWVNGVYGGVPSATVTDSLSIAGRAGALPVQARITVTGAQVALGLARVAAKIATPLTIGMAAYDFLASNGVRQGSGGAEIDPGIDPSPQSMWETSLSCDSSTKRGSGGSGAAAIADCHAKRARDGGFTPMACKTDTGYLNPNGTQYSMVCEYRSMPFPNGYISSDSYSAYKVTKNACASQVDALTGLSYVPGTYSDGKCITGRYQAANEAQITSRIATAVNSDVAAAAKASVAAGEEIPAADFSSTGPATQIGQPTNTTTTTPTGTTTTSSHSSFAYNYNGDKITYETTVVTNTCTGTGSCTTNNADTTTTTTAVKPTTQDPADPCTSDPTRLGCIKLGEAPDDKIPKNNKTVTFTQVGLGLGASCPAPVVLPRGEQISYQTICDGVVQARPLIIAMGFLMAGGIMLGALRPQ